MSPAIRSSFIVASAPTVPSGSRTGFMSSMSPIREPPSRTSLPGSRFAPLETWNFSVVDGTNGRPLFAL